MAGLFALSAGLFGMGGDDDEKALLAAKQAALDAENKKGTKVDKPKNSGNNKKKNKDPPGAGGGGGGGTTKKTIDEQVNEYLTAFTLDAAGITAISDDTTGLYSAAKGLVPSDTWVKQTLNETTLKACYDEAKKTGAAAITFHTPDKSCYHSVASGLKWASDDAFTAKDTNVSICTDPNTLPYDKCLAEPISINGSTDRWIPAWQEGWGVNGFDIGTGGDINRDMCAKKCEENPKCYAFSHSDVPGKERCFLKGYAVNTTGVVKYRAGPSEWTTYMDTAKENVVNVDYDKLPAANEASTSHKWPGGDILYEELGSMTDVQACIDAAKSKSYPGMAFRTSNHSSMPETCIGIKEFGSMTDPKKYSAMNQDHTTMCTNAGVDFSKGCMTDEARQARQLELLGETTTKEYNDAVASGDLARIEKAVGAAGLPENLRTAGKALVAEKKQSARMKNFMNYPTEPEGPQWTTSWAKSFSQNSGGVVEELGKLESPEACRAAAEAKGSLVYGVRMGTHGDPNWKGTCWTIKPKWAFHGMLNPHPDGVSNHYMQCVNKNNSIYNGCRDGNHFLLMHSATPGMKEIKQGKRWNTPFGSLVFQGDGNFVIYSGNVQGIPWVWGSGWRYNRIWLQEDGDFLGDNGAGQYKFSMVSGPHHGTGWDDPFGAMSAQYTVAGVGRGPYALFFSNNGGGDVGLFLLDKNGAIVWRTSNIRQKVLDRRAKAPGDFLHVSQTEAVKTAADLKALRARYDQYLVDKNKANDVMNTAAGKLFKKQVQRSKQVSIFTGHTNLFNNHWDGNTIAYDKSHAKTVQAGDHILAWQGDGNLVVYSGGKPLWGSGTNGNGHRQLVIEKNNVYISDGKNVLWNSKDINSTVQRWDEEKTKDIPTFFGIDMLGRLSVVRNGKLVWASPRLEPGYLTISPLMNDRPGGENRGSNSVSIESSVTKCAERCNTRTLWARCTAFSYNPNNKKCYVKNKYRAEESGDIDNNYTYYRKW